MPENKRLPPEALQQIARVTRVPTKGLMAVAALLDEGGTVPFIARYRKEATGNLDEI